MKKYVLKNNVYAFTVVFSTYLDAKGAEVLNN